MYDGALLESMCARIGLRPLRGCQHRSTMYWATPTVSELAGDSRTCSVRPQPALPCLISLGQGCRHRNRQQVVN